MQKDSHVAFADRLTQVAAAVENALARHLAAELREGEIARPERLMAAMRHAVLGGGKRLRPFLVIEAARLLGRDMDHAMNAACAVEVLHCYSLVHDDLPAMDDDDLRRGRPTVHVAFDEATAILAGDALLTLAFELAATPHGADDARVHLELVRGLARAAGLGGMVGGQILDLTAEGRYGDAPPGEGGIRTLQAMKTGALLAFSVEAGAILGHATAGERGALVAYGKALGAAFQIADDVLDREADAVAMGKRTAKDADKGKGTLVDILGLPAARAERDAIAAQAIAALSGFGPQADILRAAARFTAERRT
ncbi:MAG: polyprenyl synthetase family protein [Chelatococcus sp.]|uniref:polyprenyl synthetase family protein n=1 Tax=Chelatococcus sp. TaxID=1953771 RepID=UPI0025BA5B4E|nr:farnesyl diphosphate synthase [Chelatococcus sp.]MBX3537084.1 polyprenyl synthetase family protein [Chelatococcus sp.]